MTTEHRTTREEEAYWRLLDDAWEGLSEPARTVLREAEGAAYAAKMVHNYCFQDGEYDEAMEEMRLAAAGIIDGEHELLSKLWRAALVAAASIDSEDFETPVGRRIYRGNLYRYYRMMSGMVEETLWEKRSEEDRKGFAQMEQENPS